MNADREAYAWLSKQGERQGPDGNHNGGSQRRGPAICAFSCIGPTGDILIQTIDESAHFPLIRSPDSLADPHRRYRPHLADLHPQLLGQVAALQFIGKAKASLLRLPGERRAGYRSRPFIECTLPDDDDRAMPRSLATSNKI